MPLLYIALSLVACDLRRCDRNNAAEAVAVKQDCPTGLARCVGGAVEVSEGHTACSGCPCAYERVRTCVAGCVVEGLELVREPEQAGTLCKPAGALAVSVPPSDAGGATCPSGARFSCQAGTVYACPSGTSAVPVTVCTLGCVKEGETLDDPAVDVAGATAMMCGAKDP